MRFRITKQSGGVTLLAVLLVLSAGTAFAQTKARLLLAEDESVAPQLRPTPAVRPDARLRRAEDGSLNVMPSMESPRPTPARQLEPASDPKPVPAPSVPVPLPLAPSDAAPLEPIPDSLEINKVKVETAAFNRITPGESTLADVEKAWGQPQRARKQGNSLLHLYAIKPFEQIEVAFRQGKVASIVVRLHQILPAKELAGQLELGHFRPVLVSSDLGEILGQVYPERGVLFSFTPSDTAGTATMNVAEIIIEPVNAESFILRAETNLDAEPALSLQDIEQALKLENGGAKAHWLHGRALAARGNLDKAVVSATRAVRFDPKNVQYRLARAQILGHIGRLNEAIQEAKRAIKMSEDRPQLKARALCLVGDLLASGPVPNYNAAIEYHMRAVKTADSLTRDPHPAVRLIAKEVLVDAHLGAAHDIAWGNWKQKEKAVDRWLSRANRCADDLIENEAATEEHRFRVATRALAACVGVRGGLDCTGWTNVAVRSGRKLLDGCRDPHRKAQLEWDLGMALYDALQVCQMREDQTGALKYGKQAVVYLTMTDDGSRTATAGYLLGRLYFRLGAIHAVTDDNHDDAIVWFEKALPLLRRPIPEEAMPDLGRHGETFVSMGVSYWEAGQRDKALELTQTGVDLMQRAVRLGYLDESALSVPYNNLASMHRKIGAQNKAIEFEEMATKLNGTTRLR